MWVVVIYVCFAGTPACGDSDARNVTQLDGYYSTEMDCALAALHVLSQMDDESRDIAVMKCKNIS
jgi:hypothetical protein